jgi:maleylacetoacetate isomerase
MILHGYFRSAAAFRVRIALNLKGVEADHVFHHLRQGEQSAPNYLALNPQGLVPTLEIGDTTLTQSLAIIEYLDETVPSPPLLPKDPIGRARVRSLAQMVACDIHPIDNLRVLNYLRKPLGHSDAEVDAWYNHWAGLGLAAIEARLADGKTGRFCHGDTPGLADICLIPQVANAGRFGLDLASFVRIRAIYAAAMDLPAFAKASPSAQPDAE